MNSTAGHFTGNTTNSFVRNTQYCLVATNLSRSSTTKIFLNSPVYLAFFYLVGLFSVGGSLINGFLLVTVIKFSALRKGLGLLMPHLLTYQLIVCAVICPFSLIKYLRYSDLCAVCISYKSLEMTFAFLISWTDALLAINRVAAVVFPLKFDLFNRKAVHGLGLVVIWSISLFATVPPIFDSLGLYRMISLGACAYIPLSKTLSIVLAINTYCPLIIMAIAAVVIGGRMLIKGRSGLPWSASVRPTTYYNHTINSRVKRQKRISRMLGIAFICSVACQLPIVVAVLYGPRNVSAIMFLGFWALLQYAITPIIFITVNKDYQNGARILFRHMRGHTVSTMAESQETDPHHRNGNGHTYGERHMQY